MTPDAMLRGALGSQWELGPFRKAIALPAPLQSTWFGFSAGSWSNHE